VNDLAFVLRVVAMLDEARMRTWLFGGWAEELRGLTLPRSHRDVDLLYPAPDFRRLDAFLADGLVEEWMGKRRPYKRGFAVDGILVEPFLVQRDSLGWYTDFRRGRHRWPQNVFGRSAWPPVVSAEALDGYREAYASLHARAA
jgi:hypothetical protein